MAKKKTVDGTDTYIVTQPDTLGYAVGDTVELTADQAAKLINKVRPQDGGTPGVSGAELVKVNVALDRDNRALTAQVAALTEENARLSKQLAETVTGAS